MAQELAQHLEPAPIRELRAQPTLLFLQAGLTPDPWQAALLATCHHRLLLNCSRQAGKSQTAAALGLKTALLEPGSLTLLLSRADRQSGELFREKLLPLYRPWQQACPPLKKTERELRLANGSRIVSLPGKGDTIVGFSAARQLIIDEAARVPDDFYRVVRPMLARSGGRLMGLSTPFGKRGWFYEAWEKGPEWHKVRVQAQDCPSISPAFLAEERTVLGERWFRQEYECSFEEAIDSVFRAEDIAAAFVSDAEPLILG